MCVDSISWQWYHWSSPFGNTTTSRVTDPCPQFISCLARSMTSYKLRSAPHILKLPDRPIAMSWFRWYRELLKYSRHHQQIRVNYARCWPACGQHKECLILVWANLQWPFLAGLSFRTNFFQQNRSWCQFSRISNRHQGRLRTRHISLLFTIQKLFQSRKYVKRITTTG